MKPRRYALTLILGAAALFTSVVAANLLIDPQGVFGTNLLPRSPNINYHYEISLPMTLHPDRFDGVLFGSSRTQATPTAELSRRINGVTFANFSVIRGMLPDFLPALEYVLADKAKWAAGAGSVSPPRYRYLRRSRSNQPLHRDPAAGRESGVYFWWRNLTALPGQELAAYPARGPGRDRGKIREAPSALERVKWALVRVAALSGLAARGAGRKATTIGRLDSARISQSSCTSAAHRRAFPAERRRAYRGRQSAPSCCREPLLAEGSLASA